MAIPLAYYLTHRRIGAHHAQFAQQSTAVQHAEAVNVALQVRGVFVQIEQWSPACNYAE